MDSQRASSSKKKKSNKSFQQKIVDGGKYDFFYYSPYLGDCKTVTEKMRDLCKLSSLTQQDLSDRNFIRDKILQALKPFYPNCSVFIYGSTINGFGTKGSDLDLLFLPSPEYCKLGDEDEEEEPPSRDLVETGRFPRDQLAKMGEKAQLRFILRVFRKIFKYTMIIQAKCPILSFVATGRYSQISCDLSCRNRLVVSNTELLKFFKRIDPRVEPLIITLRFWAKAMDFLKASALSSYGFTLLVIFFLQNASPSVLPNVDYLMQMSESSCSVAGWEVAFSQDLGLIPQTENQDSEGVLLQKFFSFYWNFDFTRNIACVRTGRALPIEDMINSNIAEFQISAMCIQDPFNLSHNVGKNMKHSSLSFFKPSMFIAHSLLTSNPNNPNSKDAFSMLFDVSSFTSQIDSEFYFRDSKMSQSFLIPLDHEIIAALEDGDDLLEKFYEEASNAVFDILHYGFLMDCEIVDKASFASINKSARKPFAKRASNCLMSIQSSVYNRVWIKRNSTLIPKEFDHDADEVISAVLKYEHAISKSIISSNPQFSCPNPVLVFMCRCYKTDYPQVPYLIIEMSQLTATKEFKQVYNFLMAVLPGILKKILLENNRVA